MGEACLIQKIGDNAAHAADVQAGASEISKNGGAPESGAGYTLSSAERLQGFDRGTRGRDDPVLAALAAANMQGSTARVKIAPVQGDALAGPETAAIKDFEQRQIAEIAQAVARELGPECGPESCFGQGAWQGFGIFRHFQGLGRVFLDSPHAAKIGEETLEDAYGTADTAPADALGPIGEEASQIIRLDGIPRVVARVSEISLQPGDFGSIGADRMVRAASFRT